MIIDCHGHYTTTPAELLKFREAQLAALGASAPADPAITDDQIRSGIEGGQLRLQRERGIELTLFSPRAAGMGHHVGNATTSLRWSRICNDLVHRVCRLYPDNFAGVCQLPQSPDEPLDASAAELRRCVEELGFVGCNLNPDPSGGRWTSPPLTDRYWYPLYEAMVELDVPAMVHASASCTPALHTTGAHYLNVDTTAFVQLLTGELFRDFPSLRFVIPHGGGAVPYHWGRFRGIAQDLKRPPLAESVLRNVYFDTCVYHAPGIRLLFEVVPAENILFASELLGAVKGSDHETGHAFDDTRRYIDALQLSATDRELVFEGNARRVYPRLARRG